MRAERRLLALSGLALAAGGAWLLRWVFADHPILAHPPLQEGLRAIAILLTALLAVQAGGRAVLQLGLSAGLGMEPTGLQRAIAYGALTFTASAVALSLFGFDITAVLTTSAILTAVVGLAMQPTLGSLISGLALHVDRVLRVGDTVMIDDRPVEIMHLDWRTAVGRRRDGTVVVIPNARLSNETLVIHPLGHSARHDTLFHAPMGAPPQRVSDLVAEAIADFPQVDTARPVMVMLDATEPEHGALRYRARYWVRQTWDRPEVGSEVLRRLWYVFRRHGIPLPASRLFERAAAPAGRPAPAGGAALEAALAGALPRLPTEARRRLIEAGEALPYAPDERLAMPRHLEGSVFVILSGTAEAEADGACLVAGGAAPPLRLQRLGRAARLRGIADALARHVGPFADHAVREAAARAATPEALLREVAREIEDPAERERFLAEMGEEAGDHHGPGHWFAARGEVTGRLVAHPPLRAASELLVLAVPAALVPAAEPAAASPVP